MSHGCSPPTRTIRRTPCSRSPAAVTPPRRWRCTTATGRRAPSVPLPGLGSLRGLTTADAATPEQRGRLWIGWTDLVTPQQVRRFDLTSGATVLETAAPGAVDVPAVRTEQQRTFTSADGTPVRMFESIVREDRNVLDLIKADYTFLNERLAKHYGIPHVYGSHFRRVSSDEEQSSRRIAWPCEHPHGDVVRHSHVARDSGPVGAE